MQLTPEKIRLLNSMDETSLINLTKNLDQMQRGGIDVLNPGTNIGTATSSISKQVGVNAIPTDRMSEGANWSHWTDPVTVSAGTLERYGHMLAKSLDEVNYRTTKHWGDFGSFLKDGWFNSKNPSSGFAERHGEGFKNVDPGFFKARGLSGATGESGGFLMLPELAPSIESLFIQNDIASRIDVMNISGRSFKFARAKDTNRADGYRHGGITSFWVDEGGTLTESQPEFAFTKLEKKKLCILVYMSNEIMNENPAAIEQYVRQAVKEELAFAIARSVFWGAGGKEPIGFGTSGAVISIAKESSQSTPTIIQENLLKMESRMLSRPGSQFAWYHHQSATPQLGALSIGNMPVAININNGGISQAPAQMLRGMPLVKSEFCKQLGDAGDIFLADLKMYKGITQSLVREDVSMHVEFLTDKSCLRFIVEFDGAPLYNTPVSPYQAGSAVDTVSSFIAIATRP